MVEQVEDEHRGNKGKGSDGVNTVLGISQEEAKNVYLQQQAKYNDED